MHTPCTHTRTHAHAHTNTGTLITHINTRAHTHTHAHPHTCTQVYCHALSKDAARADPAEVARAQRLASVLRAQGRVQLVVFNSAGGRGKDTRISQVDQVGADQWSMSNGR